MSENANEKQVDHFTNELQSETSPDLNIVTEQAKVINPTQETTNMEVHHHAHHEGKKNWKTYFWEFLMLFLAVFCGFLAEYQLEHVIEHNREKQFVQSFIEDLKSDTATLNRNLVFRSKKREQLDSLSNLLSEQKIKGHESELYYLGRLLIRTSKFQSNDRTIIKLKNSGSLRLIRNEQAADSMIAYQKLVDYINLNQDDDRIERWNADPVLLRMFDAFVFEKMVTINGINMPPGNPPLRSYDAALQKDLAYCIHQIRGSYFLLEARPKLLNEKASNIIAFLKKEYHLN
jgi:hypothetical protein